MARTKIEKADILNKIKDIVKGANSLVFVNFKGVKVGDTVNMRRKFRSEVFCE